MMDAYKSKALAKATTISWGSTFGTAIVTVPLMGWASLVVLFPVSVASAVYLAHKTKKIVAP
jgi:hypothetical protein